MFHLRPATPKDVGPLFSIHRAVMHEHVDRVWSWDEAEQERRFRDYAARAHLEVIEVEGEIAGFVHIETRLEEIEIANIELAPAFQDRGIGSAILRRTLARARELGVPVTLQVLKVNPEARELYTRLGFSHVGETATHDVLRIDPAAPPP